MVRRRGAVGRAGGHGVGVGSIELGDLYLAIDHVEELVTLDRSGVLVRVRAHEGAHVGAIGVGDHHVVVARVGQRREDESGAIGCPTRLAGVEVLVSDEVTGVRPVGVDDPDLGARRAFGPSERDHGSVR